MFALLFTSAALEVANRVVGDPGYRISQRAARKPNALKP